MKLLNKLYVGGVCFTKIHRTGRLLRTRLVGWRAHLRIYSVYIRFTDCPFYPNSKISMALLNTSVYRTCLDRTKVNFQIKFKNGSHNLCLSCHVLKNCKVIEKIRTSRLQSRRLTRKKFIFL